MTLGETTNGGLVNVYNKTGEALAQMSATDNGGLVTIVNKTGEVAAQMATDEYGNGLVGVYNSKGEGRTLKAGPSSTEPPWWWQYRIFKYFSSDK